MGDRVNRAYFFAGIAANADFRVDQVLARQFVAFPICCDNCHHCILSPRGKEAKGVFRSDATLS
jgi:hypothetical protein